MIDLKPYAEEPIQSKHIENFEALIGVPLPSDYRTFLLETGGQVWPSEVAEIGCTKPGCLTSEEVFKTVELEMFSSVVPDVKGRSALSLHYDRMNGPNRENNWLPDDMIVIGNSGGAGRCFLLAIKGERRGQIFFWDINLFPQDDDVPVNYNNISFVANSFSDLLENLVHVSPLR